MKVGDKVEHILTKDWMIVIEFEKDWIWCRTKDFRLIKFKDFEFRIFNPFTKGFYTVMQVNLHNDYPHIFLDGIENSPFSRKIIKYFSDSDIYSLEGDFDKHFKVYSKSQSIDVLRILSPDMMALLIDAGHEYDIEIINGSLHIITNYKFSNRKDIEDFFTIADTLLDKLDRRNATLRSHFD